MIPNLANNCRSAERRTRLVAIGLGTAIGLVALALFSSPRAVAQSPQTAAGQAPAAGSAQSAPTSTLPTSASFEVAAIKPNRSGDWRVMMGFGPGRFTATGIWVRHLITIAYGVTDLQVTGGPSWIDSERYDIQAKEPDSVAAEMQKLSQDQREELSRSMLQSLLADRFKLKLRHETKELPAYALVVAKGGPKFQAAKPDADLKGPEGRGKRGKMVFGMGDLTIPDAPLSMLARMLSQQLGRAVRDQTGLKGNYDFTLKWAPEPGEGMMLRGPEGGNPGPESSSPPESSGPSIFTAIQDQLGLKLESTKGPVNVLVIDHIERPTEN